MPVQTQRLTQLCSGVNISGDLWKHKVNAKTHLVRWRQCKPEGEIQGQWRVSLIKDLSLGREAGLAGPTFLGTCRKASGSWFPPTQPLDGWGCISCFSGCHPCSTWHPGNSSWLSPRAQSWALMRKSARGNYTGWQHAKAWLVTLCCPVNLEPSPSIRSLWRRARTSHCGFPRQGQEPSDNKPSGTSSTRGRS